MRSSTEVASSPEKTKLGGDGDKLAVVDTVIMVIRSYGATTAVVLS